MAKKKPVESDADVLTEEPKQKKKRNIEDIIVSANSLINRKSVIIPVSSAIDLGLGGGIPEGSFGIFSGPPKCGKTTTGLQIIANAVKPEYASELKPNGREAYIFNVEGRLKKRDLLGIHGMKEVFGAERCTSYRIIAGQYIKW